jgi:LPS-assembly lipoprotein
MSWSRKGAGGRTPGAPWRVGRMAFSVAAGLAALGLLAACGFRPLYGTPQHPILPELAAIKVTPIPDRIGQQLRNMLYDRLTPKGEPRRPRYTLHVRLKTVKQSLGIQEDETVTRANLIVRADYVLRGARDGTQLIKGVSRSTTSYDVVESDFATLAAEADAERRALTVIRDDITARLSFYFTRDRRRAS